MTAKPLNFDVTPEEFAAGRHRPKMTSIYKGVCWYPGKGKWRATGTLCRKQVALGYHATDVEAARAYDTWANKYGKTLNFPAAASCTYDCRSCRSSDDRLKEDNDFEEGDSNIQIEHNNEVRGEASEAQNKKRRLLADLSHPPPSRLAMI
jgi:hypothetical protein